jgi:uncharacterized membrane protein YidH (DUF202 family)
MRPGTIIGILLIVVGVAGFALGGFSFTHKEKVLDTAEDKDTVPIPPILAGLALVGGVVLVVASSRRT